MKRSVLDDAIRRALALAAECGFALPPFATWTREQWLDRADQLEPMLTRGVGWDVTDFGRGDFERYGLTLCTLRNGSLAERDAGVGQTFAEKLMLVGVGQETPFHLHNVKTEDIINRGGGTLSVEVRPALTPGGGGGPGPGSVRTFVSGELREIAAGEPVLLAPGEWVQVPLGRFHRFVAVDAPVLAAEVSSVNDDVLDNVFLGGAPRFPEIEEDVAARYLVVAEYEAVLAARRPAPRVSDAQRAALHRSGALA